MAAAEAVAKHFRDNADLLGNLVLSEDTLRREFGAQVTGPRGSDARTLVAAEWIRRALTRSAPTHSPASHSSRDQPGERAGRVGRLFLVEQVVRDPAQDCKRDHPCGNPLDHRAQAS